MLNCPKSHDIALLICLGFFSGSLVCYEEEQYPALGQAIKTKQQLVRLLRTKNPFCVKNN